MNEIFNETIMVMTFEGARCDRKWPRQFLVEAKVLPPFAIHPSTERFSFAADPNKLFTVTHVPSRTAIFRHRKLNACAGFVGDVRALDWSFLDRRLDCPESCKAYLSWETAEELFPDVYIVLDAIDYWRKQ